MDLLNCYPMKPGHEEILELIRDILQSRNLTESEQQQFSNAVKGLLPSLANIDMNRTAQLVLDYFQVEYSYSTFFLSHLLLKITFKVESFSGFVT